MFILRKGSVPMAPIYFIVKMEANPASETSTFLKLQPLNHRQWKNA
jgi:hypothetical protein